MTVSSALIGWSPSSSEEGLCQSNGFRRDGEPCAARERERERRDGSLSVQVRIIIIIFNFHGLQSGIFAFLFMYLSSTQIC